MRTLTQFVTSGSRGWAAHYNEEGPIFLRIGNISTTSIKLNFDHIQRVSPPPGAEGERTQVRPGDILVSITAQMGAVGLAPDEIPEAYVNQHTALIRLRPGSAVPMWVALSLLSPVGKQQFNLAMNGGTKVGLTLDDVRNVQIALPPIDEQECLCARIEAETEAIDATIDRIAREIDLIREYRTRLVADVVTGQLDVRAAAVALPDVDPLAEAGDAEGADLDDLTADEPDADDEDNPDEMADAAD